MPGSHSSAFRAIRGLLPTCSGLLPPSHLVPFGGGREYDPVLLTLGRLQQMPQPGKKKDPDAIWIS